MEYDCMNCGNVHTPEEGCPDETAVSNSALSDGVSLLTPYMDKYLEKLDDKAKLKRIRTDKEFARDVFKHFLEFMSREIYGI